MELKVDLVIKFPCGCLDFYIDINANETGAALKLNIDDEDNASDVDFDHHHTLNDLPTHHRCLIWYHRWLIW
jgi:hypothetical protein